jgi:hypothetical protein
MAALTGALWVCALAVLVGAALAEGPPPRWRSAAIAQHVSKLAASSAQEAAAGDEPGPAAKGYLLCPTLAKPHSPDFDAQNLGVDPFIGSGGDGYGCAALNPGAQLPHGPVRVGADTALDGLRIEYRTFGGYRCCAALASLPWALVRSLSQPARSYCDSHIRAFSHTHMVGSGVLDMGNVGLMPTAGISAQKVRTARSRRFAALLRCTWVQVTCTNAAPWLKGTDMRACGFRQRYSHAAGLEEAVPGRYATTLLDEQVRPTVFIDQQTARARPRPRAGRRIHYRQPHRDGQRRCSQVHVGLPRRRSLGPRRHLRSGSPGTAPRLACAEGALAVPHELLERGLLRQRLRDVGDGRRRRR